VPYKADGWAAWAQSTHAANMLPAAASQAESCLNNHRPISQHKVAGSVGGWGVCIPAAEAAETTSQPLMSTCL